MRKTITLEYLLSINACSPAVEAFKVYLISDPIEVLKKAMELNRFDWANWLIVRLMNKKQKVQYAVFAAELVIEIYEKKYPEDERPRKAIEAAKDYLKNPSKKSKSAAAAAADAAYSAYAAAAYSAADADAAYAAYSAAAAAAAYSAYAAAAYSAADAAVCGELKTKIINNGIEILKGKS